MKTWLITIIAMLSTLVCSAQSNKVIVGTKKVYLKYAGSYNQNDSLLLPVVSAKYPALKAALSDNALFAGDKLENIVLNYEQCACGTTGFNYEVVYFDNNYISLKLFYEGMGAYPSTWQNWLTLNIQTGKPYPLSKHINLAGQRFITTKYKAVMLKRIKQDKIDDKDVYKQLIQSINELKPADIMKTFVLAKTGIFFKSENILPHAVQSFEPDHEVFFSYAQLKPFWTGTKINIPR